MWTAGKRLVVSRLIVAPDWLASAAAEVQSIGFGAAGRRTRGRAPTTLLVAAAEDEVSAAAAAPFATTAGSIGR